MSVQLTAKQGGGLDDPGHPVHALLSGINSYRDSPFFVELFSRREGERTSSKARETTKTSLSTD